MCSSSGERRRAEKEPVAVGSAGTGISQQKPDLGRPEGTARKGIVGKRPRDN